MKDWKVAGDHLKRRNVTSIIESLEVETPFNFSRGDVESDVPQFIESAWHELGDAAEKVFSLVGRDINFVRDILISLLKYLHVLHTARQLRFNGALTWSLVDAYHATLLGIRAIAAFHGAVSYNVKGRTVMLDFRPASGAPDDVKKFERDHRSVENPVRFIRPVKDKLEQRDAWYLLLRLCRINNCQNESERSLIDQLEELAPKPISSLRNLILYDSVYWTWFSDFKQPTMVEHLLKDAFEGNDEVRPLLEGLGLIHSVINFYSTRLFSHLSIDPHNFPELRSCQDLFPETKSS